MNIGIQSSTQFDFNVTMEKDELKYEDGIALDLKKRSQENYSNNTM
jgi:hypothetical protein